MNHSFDNDSSNARFDPHAYLYRNLSAYFLSWYLPLVLVVGLCGNSFILVVLFLSRMFPKTMLLWLVSICIGDLLVLLTDALRMCLKVLADGFDIRDLNPPICRAHNYLSNFALIWAAYMQTGISLQRLYLVLRPLHARVHLTFPKVFIVWGVIAVAVTLPQLPYQLYWHINPKSGDCEPVDVWFYYVTTLVDLVIWGMIPLITMTITTALIVGKIYKRERDFGNHLTAGSNMANMKQNEVRPRSEVNEVSTRASGGQKDAMSLPRSNVTSNRTSTMTSQSSDGAHHMTRILVGLNLFYMLTTYPLLIYLMYLNFGLQNKVGVTIPQSVHKFIYYLLRSLCYLNSSFDWMFYSVSGRSFRERLWAAMSTLLCPSRLKKRGTRNFQNSTDTYRQSEHVSSHM